LYCRAAGTPRPILEKIDAWTETYIVARQVWLETEGATSYAVEPASKCKRLSRYAVNCTYTETAIISKETFVWGATARVRINEWGEISYTLSKLRRVRDQNERRSNR
jgi:hypothetical protein